MARTYVGDYYHSVMEHYELTAGHLANTKGYDFYHRVGKHIERHGADASAQGFVELMPFGTPEQVIEKVRFIHERIGNNGLLATFSFGGMPPDVAERNVRLFAEKVLPALKELPTAPFAFAQSA